jgi:hypothetical protein
MPDGKRVWLGVLAAALLTLPQADGAGGARAAEGPSIEPQAAATLRSALDKIAAAKSFSFRAEVLNDSPLPSGEKIQFPGVLDVAVRRPDRLRVRLDGEQRASHSWYDGKTFSLLSPEANTFASCPGPERLDDLFTQLRENYGFTPPLAILLREDVAERTFARVRTGHTVGRGVVGGVDCTHLAFRGENVDWQVWVAAEGAPLIKRVVITWKNEPGAPQFIATFLAWDFDARLDDAEFAFTPPKDAVQCEFGAFGK